MNTHAVYWAHLPEHKVGAQGYVGVTQHLRKRIRNHKYPTNGCTALRNAIAKHGDAVVWVVLATFDDPDDAYALESSLRPAPFIGWNMAIGGDVSATLGREVTPETRAKIRAANKGHVVTPEQRAKISAALTGRKTKPLTAEHRAKLSAAATGRVMVGRRSPCKGKKLTPEHRAKLSAAKLGKKRGPMPQEQRANHSAAMIRYWAKKRIAR